MPVRKLALPDRRDAVSILLWTPKCLIILTRCLLHFNLYFSNRISFFNLLLEITKLSRFLTLQVSQEKGLVYMAVRYQESIRVIVPAPLKRQLKECAIICKRSLSSECALRLIKSVHDYPTLIPAKTIHLIKNK